MSVDEAHLAEGGGPLQRQQEARPGAGAGVPLGPAVGVVLREVGRNQQQNQERRTNAEQQGQHRAVHLQQSGQEEALKDGKLQRKEEPERVQTASNRSRLSCKLKKIKLASSGGVRAGSLSET